MAKKRKTTYIIKTASLKRYQPRMNACLARGSTGIVIDPISKGAACYTKQGRTQNRGCGRWVMRIGPKGGYYYQKNGRKNYCSGQRAPGAVSGYVRSFKRLNKRAPS